jgi:chemotaxis protein CheX
LNGKRWEPRQFTLPDERKAVVINVNAAMVAQTVEAVFLAMMDLEVSPGETTWAPSPGQLTSAVHLSGVWSGALLFECDRRQACQFAGRFLSMDPPEAVTDDVRDVLGELANMIGGNIKSAVAAGLSLSMPSVTDGSDYALRVYGSDVQDRLAFECDYGPFWVTLLPLAPGENTGSNPLFSNLQAPRLPLY